MFSKERYINRYLFVTLGIMLAIFLFSHSTGDESTKQSGIIVTLLSYLPIEIDEKNINIITIIVRKCAHMTEYFLLTLSLIRYFYSVKLKNIYLRSGIVSFLYACSDEFHQTFVPGRAGLFSDVLIDSVGIVLALISAHSFIKLFSKSKDKKKDKR